MPFYHRCVNKIVEMNTFVALLLVVAITGTRAGFLNNGATSVGGSGEGVVLTGNSAGPSAGFGLSNAVLNSVVPSSVAAVPSAGPRVHEIHTREPRPVIRLEEFTSPNQVIRVHEGPQAPPQLLRVQAPNEPQTLIRVVSRGSGPAHVERIVHRPSGEQVVNVQRPAPPPARIVQVVRGPAPPPRVEFLQEPDNDNQVYVANGPTAGPAPAAVVAGGPTAVPVGAVGVAVAPTTGHVVTSPAVVSSNVVSDVPVAGQVEVNPSVHVVDSSLTDGSGVLEPRGLPVPTRHVVRW